MINLSLEDILSTIEKVNLKKKELSLYVVYDATKTFRDIFVNNMDTILGGGEYQNARLIQFIRMKLNTDLGNVVYVKIPKVVVRYDLTKDSINRIRETKNHGYEMKLLIFSEEEQEKKNDADLYI